MLARVKAVSLAAQSHQDLPFEQVVEIVQPPRSLAHAPLFQVMFVWQNTPEGRLELPGLTLSPIETTHVTARVDLSLSLGETGEEITGGLEYATSLFEPSTIERYLGYWRQLLEGMVADEKQAVDRLPLLSAAERRKVLVDWNDTAADYPADQCIHELFEAQASRTPDAVAVVYEDRHLTYAELNARANRLARHLRGLGVKPDDRVAICVERGLEMVVGLLAILKAGGAYVPLDPAYPAERLAYMLEDSASAALLTGGAARAALDGCGCLDMPVVDLEGDAALWAAQPESNPERAGLTPDHLAYVIYTSGSTGRPKGVMVEHRGLCNYVSWAADAYTPTEGSVVSSPLAFDATVTSLYTPLLCGSSLSLLSERGEIWGINQIVSSDERCGLVKITPAHLELLGKQILEGKRRVSASQFIIGGEELWPSTVQLWHNLQHDIRLINEYGPTETVVGCTVYNVPCPFTLPHTVPIGRPIANTQIYILDAYGEPSPIGVAGEIHVGGAGVARGYLNRPELTTERFVADAFAGKADARMYKTGDLGRWLADGTIEFLGRNDFQVKIRGFRIELGEIEARLLEHPGVREAVVAAREDSPGDKRLAAYYTGDEAIGAEALRAHLAAKLPEHMVPAAYVRLAALPLTPNGKLDRQALPAPEGEVFAARSYEPPQGEIEEAVARIWAELLKVERVGRHDNFFELGGHSLLAVQLVSALKQSGMDISLAQLFTHPTIERLARQGAAKNWALQEPGVIPFRAQGKASPLFLVHEISGEMFYGQMLTRHIDANIPIYGLTSEPLAKISLRTMQGMAARLVRAIRAVQTAGPYRIAGWSFGGKLAYEIATQFIGEDETIEFLGLIDTVCRAPRADLDRFLEYDIVLRDFVMRAHPSVAVAAELNAIQPGDFDALARKCQELLPVTKHLSETEIHQYISRYRTHILANNQYQPYPIPVPVHLFAAQDSYTDDESLGWSTVVPSGLIHIIPVPGDHNTMIEEPHVAMLGTALSQAIHQAGASRPAQVNNR